MLHKHWICIWGNEIWTQHRVTQDKKKKAGTNVILLESGSRRTMRLKYASHKYMYAKQLVMWNISGIRIRRIRNELEMPWEMEKGIYLWDICKPHAMQCLYNPCVSLIRIQVNRDPLLNSWYRFNQPQSLLAQIKKEYTREKQGKKKRIWTNLKHIFFSYINFLFHG